MQLCSDPPVHCSTAQGKMHSALLSTALQIRLTAGLCVCNHNSEDLLFMQVGIGTTPMHCSTAQGNKHTKLLICKTG